VIFGKANYFEAQKHCRSQGMKLKTFIDREEQSYIYQKLLRTHDCGDTGKK